MAVVKLPVEHVSAEWMGKEEETLFDVNEHHVIFTVGVSASGKTTWSEQFAKSHPNWVVISRDYARADLLSPGKFSWTAWKKRGSRGEKEVNFLVESAIDMAIRRGIDVIIADTNLSPNNFNSLAAKFRDHGYVVHFKFFPIDWKTAVERDNARLNGVGVSVISAQFEKLHKLERQKSKLHSRGGYQAILCDIDGTLAHMVSRGPYDYSDEAIATDAIDEDVREILASMAHRGFKIIIVSGRDGVCREATHKWLTKYLTEQIGIQFSHYQRAEGDKRPDDQIKEELLHKIIEDGFDPIMVFDDRPRVCRMWRRLGLKVFQVGNPYIEF